MENKKKLLLLWFSINSFTTSYETKLFRRVKRKKNKKRIPSRCILPKWFFFLTLCCSDCECQMNWKDNLLGYRYKFMIYDCQKAKCFRSKRRRKKNSKKSAICRCASKWKYDGVHSKDFQLHSRATHNFCFYRELFSFLFFWVDIIFCILLPCIRNVSLSMNLVPKASHKPMKNPREIKS